MLEVERRRRGKGTAEKDRNFVDQQDPPPKTLEV